MQNRSWEWTPPPTMNRVMSTVLRLPVLHRMMSKEILLLTFTGRKSGKKFTTPVGYFREGNTVTLLTKQFRPWWRNFINAAPVQMRMEGKTAKGTAKALTDTATITPIIANLMEKHPREAQIYGVGLLPDGKPNMDDVNRIAPKVVIIQITLEK